MPLMRRRPLLRAAAVGGGAYMMGRRNAERQQAEYTQDERISGLENQQYQQAPPQGQAPAQSQTAPGGMSPDAMDRLKQLADLHAQGVLTDEEFADQKAKLLA